MLGNPLAVVHSIIDTLKVGVSFGTLAELAIQMEHRPLGEKDTVADHESSSCQRLNTYGCPDFLLAL
jgi:hypothetical protein